MGVIRLTDQNGATHRLPAAEGWRVMEIIRDAGLPIGAECGGACACATCHVHVAPEWAGRLHGARDDEEDRLDTVEDYGPTSRLSCQIIWTEALDGLELSLPGAGARPGDFGPEARLP
ncbi:Ferredoxin, 2Fe-2S [hydrothermal vent metagenome]|uniref:Ferredoxin, 2Fe-2S n=1 Tax=hydrothermal vent metagenome TaxID=652676 RepID=A0A3B0TKZ3_9ZZZZ